MPWDKETAAAAGKKSKRGPETIRAKITKDLLNGVDSNHMVKVMIKDAMALKGERRVYAIKAILEYILPKPKSLDISNDDGSFGKFIIQIIDDNDKDK